MFSWILGQKEKPKLNYLWIGHPPLSESGEHTVAGQDVKDVVAMSEVCKNPVYFYCLEEYQDHYHKIFKGTKVNVQSIDAYIRKMKNSRDKEIREFAGKILQIQQTVLTPPRGKVIDFVSLKEVFSLFLLATQGGYTADSNIHPAKGVTSVELSDYAHFKAPYTGPMIEIWMMYASSTHLDEPRAMLRAYLAGWNKVQAMLVNNSDPQGEKEEITVSSPNEYPKLYHQFIIDLTVGAVESVYVPSLRTDQDWEFTIDIGEAHYEAKCKGIPVEKSYGNSHKHDAVYAKNQARFDLDRKSSFLENKIKKAFEEPTFTLFPSTKNHEQHAFEVDILQFITKEENRVPEKIIAKLEELGKEAQNRCGDKSKACGFKKAVDDIIEEFKTAFPTRSDQEKKYGLH